MSEDQNIELSDKKINPSLYSKEGFVYNYDLHPKDETFLEKYFETPPLRYFIDYIKKKRGNPKVLDLGGGIGMESAWMKKLLPEAKIVSIDISTAGSKSAKTTYSLDQIQGDITKPPFSTDAFDAIHCKDVIVHVEDKDGFLTSVSKILKSGGRLLIVSSEDYWEKFVQYKWSPDELIQQAKSHGLDLESNEKINIGTEDWYSEPNKRVMVTFKKR